MIDLDRNTAPAFRGIEEVSFIPPTRSYLDNGIEVNIISGGSQEIVKIDFVFNAGTWFQRDPLIAGATNNLLKEGTKHFSAQEIAENIDQYGAFLETEVGYDKAKITLYTLNKHLETVLPFFKEVVSCTKFSEHEFEIYRSTSMEKFKVNLEKVSFVARKNFMPHLFGPTHPYGSNAEVTDYVELQLNKIKAFHNECYGLGNCYILVSGKVEPSVLDQLNSTFGMEKVLPKEFTSTEHAISPASSEKVFIEKKDAMQSALRIGRVMPNKKHPDYFGLQVLNTVLGGYFGSRLMKNIREDKGYTYGIGSGVVSLQHAGYFVISSEVGGDVTQNALQEVYKEIEVLQSHQISEDEMELVRNYILGNFLKSCDGVFNMATLFEGVHNYGLDYTFYDQYLKAIREISTEELMDLAQKYFKASDLKEVVVGEK